MSQPNLKKVFNNHLVEFLEDVIEIFPENVDLKTGLTMIEGLKFAKPSFLITIWKTSIRQRSWAVISRAHLKISSKSRG